MNQHDQSLTELWDSWPTPDAGFVIKLQTHFRQKYWSVMIMMGKLLLNHEQ